MNKVQKIAFFSLLIMLLASQVVYADSWGDLRTYELDSSDSWKSETTLNDWMASYKTAQDNNYDVYTHAKTMWSSPAFRMVNSQGSVRSDSVSTPGEGRTTVGTGNTGTPGYYYFGSVKPAWNQAGTDTIKLQFRAR